RHTRSKRDWRSDVCSSDLTDEYGRLIESEQSDGSAELISYDAAGRPVEFVDAEGGLTKVEYNLAGRITQITTPEHRTMQYEYDRAEERRVGKERRWKCADI